MPDPTQNLTEEDQPEDGIHTFHRQDRVDTLPPDGLECTRIYWMQCLELVIEKREFDIPEDGIVEELRTWSEDVLARHLPNCENLEE